MIQSRKGKKKTKGGVRRVGDHRRFDLPPPDQG